MIKIKIQLYNNKIKHLGNSSILKGVYKRFLRLTIISRPIIHPFFLYLFLLEKKSAQPLLTID